MQSVSITTKQIVIREYSIQLYLMKFINDMRHVNVGNTRLITSRLSDHDYSVACMFVVYFKLFYFIGNFDIFPLISPTDIVSISEPFMVLKIIGKSDVKTHYDITNKTNVGLAAILVIMSVSIFKIVVILYLFWCIAKNKRCNKI